MKFRDMLHPELDLRALYCLESFWRDCCPKLLSSKEGRGPEHMSSEKWVLGATAILLTKLGFLGFFGLLAYIGLLAYWAYWLMGLMSLRLTADG